MATEEFKKTINTLWSDYLELRKQMKDEGHDTVKYDWQQYRDDYLKFTTEVSASYNSDLEDFDYEEEDDEKEDE